MVPVVGRWAAQPVAMCPLVTVIAVVAVAQAAAAIVTVAVVATVATVATGFVVQTGPLVEYAEQLQGALRLAGRWALPPTITQAGCEADITPVVRCSDCGKTLPQDILDEKL